MEISEIRIYPQESGSDEKLKAFVTITIDDAFVIRDLKIIEGKKGLFIAMPSAKITTACTRCNKKNPIRNRFCGNCGGALEDISKDPKKATYEDHRDIAHPINNKTREYLHNKVMEAYFKEKSIHVGKAVYHMHSEASDYDFDSDGAL